MADPLPTEEQLVEAIYSMAAEQMRNGMPPGTIEQNLMEKGLDAESAGSVVRNL